MTSYTMRFHLRLCQATLLILFLLSPERGRADECDYGNFDSVLKTIEAQTAEILPPLKHQRDKPFSDCFKKDEETDAIADIRAAIEDAEKEPEKQKLPIILVPGYLATDEYDFGITTVDYWFDIVNSLQDAGYLWVYAANIDPVGYSTHGPIPGSEILDDRIGAVPDGYNGRSCQLKVFVNAVLQATEASQVNLIAHSQGALTARWMISNMGMADKVAALVTVSGANRGVPLTNLALGKSALPKWLIDSFESVMSHVLGDVCHGSNATSAHGSHVEMWPPYVDEFFNPNCPDVDQVQYFSFSARIEDYGYTEFSPYLLSEFWAIHRLYKWMNVGPNDGLVDRESAKGPKDNTKWVYAGEVVGKKVIPGTGIKSELFGLYWGVDHGAFMNFPLGLSKYYHFDVGLFYVDIARLLNAYTD